MLAGVSVDYIVRLEQGRGPKPSDQVLGALARALRLDEDDRNLMFRLAGSEPPAAGRIPLLIRPSVYRLLDRMADLPVVVLSAKSDVLAWNPMAAALFGDFSEWPPSERDLIYQRFLGGGLGRAWLTPEEEAATADYCVGCLRSARARYSDDPGLTQLIGELRSRSPRFDELWRSGRSHQLRSSTKTIAHPEFGHLTLDCDTLLVPDSDQTVIVYSAAPGTREASALDLLRVTGLERFGR
ncbi:helix-turn-helix transcriptional regulator [Nocardia sp. IFM 10818]